MDAGGDIGGREREREAEWDKKSDLNLSNINRPFFPLQLLLSLKQQQEVCDDASKVKACSTIAFLGGH
jgi:hypothetical protein